MSDALYAADVLRSARSFFEVFESSGDLRAAAESCSIPYDQAFRWVYLDRPRSQREGRNWPFDHELLSEEEEAELKEAGLAASEVQAKYTYSAATDIYVFLLPDRDEPYPLPGDVVRSLVRNYSNYDGMPTTVAEAALAAGLPRTTVQQILRALGKVHASDPRTPEELAAGDLELMVQQDLEAKRQRYATAFQAEDWRRTQAEAELYRRAEYVHQRRADELRAMLSDITREYTVPQLELPDKARLAGPHLLDLSITDLHYGKLAYADVSGTDYNREIAREVYLGSISELLAKASVFEIEECLLEIGNDLFHVDNARHTTTHGTPQDVDGLGKEHFREVLEMVMLSIDLILQAVPKVRVLIMPGNHDEERTFYLGLALERIYAAESRITFDTSSKARKYVLYGATLLGKSHGKGPKDSDLPKLMAVEAPRLWAEARFREFHIAHRHIKEYGEFVVGGEFHGVRTRRKPSLSGTDIWHFGEGYHGAVRAAEAYLYHKTGGFAACLSVNL